MSLQLNKIIFIVEGMFLIARVGDTSFHIKSLERSANYKDSGA